jgi:hypothetical protein
VKNHRKSMLYLVEFFAIVHMWTTEMVHWVPRVGGLPCKFHT